MILELFPCKPIVLKKIHFIINPAAGTEEPIISIIAAAFHNAAIPFVITESKAPGDIFDLVKVLQDTDNIVAVYGGDGTVMEAARALHGSSTPLFIVPGGTANVMAKELNIPVDTEEAISMLVTGDYTIKTIDMGLVNGTPFLIRVNLGILSDMITETDPEMKEKWGQWAYGLTAFQKLPKEGTLFHLTIDGEPYSEKAVALTITNAGNIGREGYSFLPGISVNDGMLDVISMSDANLWSLLKVTGSMLFQKDSELLNHRQAKEITIRGDGNLHFLCDDKEQTAAELKIRISPASLNVAVPKTKDNA